MDRGSRSSSIQIQYVCDECVGHGYVPVNECEIDTCTKCAGTGLTAMPVTSGWHDDVIYVKGDRYVKG